ncbi:hypothetical protein M885DRAFT_511015 [Pelagophyceae sp. CCMP2097]|nr:hypothetical protein M885DRAFT_511015 [Pelagophyceae sp. CCMP2097]
MVSLEDLYHVRQEGSAFETFETSSDDAAFKRAQRTLDAVLAELDALDARGGGAPLTAAPAPPTPGAAGAPAAAPDAVASLVVDEHGFEVVGFPAFHATERAAVVTADDDDSDDPSDSEYDEAAAADGRRFFSAEDHLYSLRQTPDDDEFRDSGDPAAPRVDGCVRPHGPADDDDDEALEFTCLADLCRRDEGDERRDSDEGPADDDPAAARGERPPSLAAPPPQSLSSPARVAREENPAPPVQRGFVVGGGGPPMRLRPRNTSNDSTERGFVVGGAPFKAPARRPVEPPLKTAPLKTAPAQRPVEPDPEWRLPASSNLLPADYQSNQLQALLGRFKPST